jgi:hypothetical protein
MSRLMGVSVPLVWWESMFCVVGGISIFGWRIAHYWSNLRLGIFCYARRWVHVWIWGLGSLLWFIWVPNWTFILIRRGRYNRSPTSFLLVFDSLRRCIIYFWKHMRHCSFGWWCFFLWFYIISIFCIGVGFLGRWYFRVFLIGFFDWVVRWVVVLGFVWISYR